MSSANPVLVTGGSGFIARALIAALSPNWNIRASQRRNATSAREVVVGDMGRGADWRRALEDVRVIVHLAGPSNAYFPEAEIRRGIVDGAAELLDQAQAAGAHRFIYISSMKACAGSSADGPLNEDTPPRPADAYGRAKLEAERLVLEHAALKPIVLRPPLVYAASAKGNLAKFMARLDSPAPLPFAGIANRRSLIALDSFVGGIAAVLRKESEPAGLFHMADEPAVSTAQMASLLRQGMGRPARLFAMPGFDKLGPPPLVQSLEVDAGRFRTTFHHAGIDTREGLVACGRAWRAQR